ncbi:MAG: toxin-antitoxin system TumE family protein [Candidatus Freyarchaeota archaeon]
MSIFSIYITIKPLESSYTLVKENKRIIGWDNTPHHLTVETHPDHFHM